MALTSGDYLTKVQRRVIVWPAPDANGDGAPVWEEKYDANGQNIGRMRVKDKWGKEIRFYTPPEGFKDVRSFDGTSNWVLHDEYDQVYRRSDNGEAVSIKPGQGLVFNPDGSVNVLEDEYSQYVFEQAHDLTDETGAVVEKTVEPEETEEDFLRRRLQELEAEKAGK